MLVGFAPGDGSQPLKASIMAALAVITSSTSSCSSLPKQPASDPTNTPRNASTSEWFGQSSNGSHSFVRQVSTGIERYLFSETWFAGGKIIATEGSCYFEPSTNTNTNTNLYNYSKPEGIVVVQTNELSA